MLRHNQTWDNYYLLLKRILQLNKHFFFSVKTKVSVIFPVLSPKNCMIRCDLQSSLFL